MQNKDLKNSESLNPLPKPPPKPAANIFKYYVLLNKWNK